MFLQVFFCFTDTSNTMIYSMSFVWNRSVHARYYLIQQKTNTYSKLFSWFPQDYSHLDVKSLILLFNSRSELHFDGLSSFYLLIWTSTKGEGLASVSTEGGWERWKLFYQANMYMNISWTSIAIMWSRNRDQSTNISWSSWLVRHSLHVCWQTQLQQQ